MFVFRLCLIGFSVLPVAAWTGQDFISSAEMDISSCPITYYGQKYETAFVNFNTNRFSVCFRGSYRPGIQNDCILISGGTADRGNLFMLRKEIPTGSGVHKLLPNLKYAGNCVNVLPLKDSEHYVIQQIELGNFGAQSILGIKTLFRYSDANLPCNL